MKVKPKDIAAHPIVVSLGTELKKAASLLSFSGQRRLFVVKDDLLRGVLRRRVIDGALRYGLSGPVEEFIDPEVNTFPAEREIAIKNLIQALRHPLGIAVVFKKTRLWGYFSWEELSLFSPSLEAISWPQIDLPQASFFSLLGNLAEKLGIKIYLVGGAVRDALLGKKVFDLDIVVSEELEAFVQKLFKNFSVEICSRSPFGTYKVHIPEKGVLDIAQSRWEYYEQPGELPIVQPGSLKEDLFRRDFTINSLAVPLNGPLKGKILDLFGGLKDLQEKRLRLFHVLSLVEDPTRIFRAARYVSRFSLSLGLNFHVSLQLVRKYDLLKKLSPARIHGELKRLVKETSPEEALDLLFSWGIFRDLLGLKNNSLLLFRKFFHLIRGIDLSEEEILQAWSLLFSEETPEWQRIFHLPPSQVRGLKKDLSFLKQNYKKLLSIKRLSQKVSLMDKVSPPSLLAFATIFPTVQDLVRNYFLHLRQIRPQIKGKDLLKAGINSGPKIGQMLKRLREAWIDKDITSSEEEWNFLKKEFPDVFS